MYVAVIGLFLLEITCLIVAWASISSATDLGLARRLVTRFSLVLISGAAAAQAYHYGWAVFGWPYGSRRFFDIFVQVLIVISAVAFAGSWFAKGRLRASALIASALVGAFWYMVAVISWV